MEGSLAITYYSSLPLHVEQRQIYWLTVTDRQTHIHTHTHRLIDIGSISCSASLCHVEETLVFQEYHLSEGNLETIRS